MEAAKSLDRQMYLFMLRGGDAALKKNKTAKSLDRQMYLFMLRVGVVQH